MKFNKLILAASVVTIISATSFAHSALAWHPSGVITKKVQNVTTSGALSEADSALQAVSAKPGDTLKYVIEIRNDGTSDAKGYNDMAKTVMTDTLPSGVTLIANPGTRQITESIGLIKPGQKVTKEYLVKVTATSDTTITNTACFTGDSTVNDNPQKGCNTAVVTVTVPAVVPPVVTPSVPTTPVTPAAETPAIETPVELPHTGSSINGLLTIIMLAAIGYSSYYYIQSKQALKSAFHTK